MRVVVGIGGHRKLESGGDVPARADTTLQVAWALPRRGLHELPALTAVTLFPLGTFRVWTVWRPAAQVLVYPAPESHPPPLPPGEPQPGFAGSASVQSTGYVFQTDLAYRAVRAGLRVVEVPIEFVERVRGDSKMSGPVASESLRRITRWGLRERRTQLAHARQGRPTR